MRTKSFLKVVGAALSLSLFTTNVLLAYSPETAFWSERQKALHPEKGDADKNRTLLASLPSHFQSNPAQILNQLPVLSRPSALPASRQPGSISKQIRKEIPKQFESHYSSLLGALPPTFGSIRKISVPKISVPGNAKNSKTIVHIQDVHLNPEAQGNTGKAIQELIDQKKIDLVALEGAFGPVDFSRLRTFPYQDSIKAVADYLLREKEISGAVYTAFISPSQIPPIIGVDEREHYNANVEAYKRSVPLVKNYKDRLSIVERNLQEQKATFFNRELAEFDSRVQAFRQGRLSWGDYVRFLATESNHFSSDLEVFIEALKMESALNFTQVESERARLLTELVSKLSENQTADLLNHSAAYRVGSLSHTYFYEYLKGLCEKSGIRLNAYKAMDGYIRYVLLSDAINVEKVLQEATALEKSLYAALTKTPEEKQLVERSKQLYLTGKLLDFALTTEEWAEYKELSLFSNVSVGSLIGFPTTAFGDDNLIAPQLNLSSFERFYEEAEVRDQAMAENLMKAMEASNASVAVLVTGGFHSKGIGEEMKRRGIATITYVPKITKVEDQSGTSYLSVFTQEKTPLDKLFAGEKLFVTPNPLGGMGGAAALSALHLSAGDVPGIDAAQIISDLSGAPLLGPVQARKTNTGAELKGRKGTLGAHINRAGEIMKVYFVPALFTVGAFAALSQVVMNAAVQTFLSSSLIGPALLVTLGVLLIYLIRNPSVALDPIRMRRSFPLIAIALAFLLSVPGFAPAQVVQNQEPPASTQVSSGDGKEEEGVAKTSFVIRWGDKNYDLQDLEQALEFTRELDENFDNVPLAVFKTLEIMFEDWTSRARERAVANMGVGDALFRFAVKLRGAIEEGTGPENGAEIDKGIQTHPMVSGAVRTGTQTGNSDRAYNFRLSFREDVERLTHLLFTYPEEMPRYYEDLRLFFDRVVREGGLRFDTLHSLAFSTWGRWRRDLFRSTLSHIRGNPDRNPSITFEIQQQASDILSLFDLASTVVTDSVINSPVGLTADLEHVEQYRAQAEEEARNGKLTPDELNGRLAWYAELEKRMLFGVLEDSSRRVEQRQEAFEKLKPQLSAAYLIDFIDPNYPVSIRTAAITAFMAEGSWQFRELVFSRNLRLRLRSYLTETENISKEDSEEVRELRTLLEMLQGRIGQMEPILRREIVKLDTSSALFKKVLGSPWEINDHIVFWMDKAKEDVEMADFIRRLMVLKGNDIGENEVETVINGHALVQASTYRLGLITMFEFTDDPEMLTIIGRDILLPLSFVNGRGDRLLRDDYSSVETWLLDVVESKARELVKVKEGQLKRGESTASIERLIEALGNIIDAIDSTSEIQIAFPDEQDKIEKTIKQTHYDITVRSNHERLEQIRDILNIARFKWWQLGGIIVAIGALVIAVIRQYSRGKRHGEGTATWFVTAITVLGLSSSAFAGPGDVVPGAVSILGSATGQVSGFGASIVPSVLHPIYVVPAFIVLIAVVAVVVFKRKSPAQRLAQDIQREYAASNADRSAVNRVIADINGRLGGDLSFNLANAIRISPQGTSERTAKAFAIGLVLAVKNAIGQFFNSLEAALAAAFKTDADLVTLVHVTSVDDVAKLREALAAAKDHNESAGASLAVVGVVLSREADQDLASIVQAEIDRASPGVPVATVQQGNLNVGDNGQIAYATLFSTLAGLFQTQPKAHRIFSDLSRDDVSEKKLVVIGVSNTPYSASEKLLQIMISLVPVRGGFLMIDIQSVLLAAKMA